MSYSEPSVSLVSSASLLSGSSNMSSGGGDSSVSAQRRLVSSGSCVLSGTICDSEESRDVLYGAMELSLRSYHDASESGEVGYDQYVIAASDISSCWSQTSGLPAARIVCSQIQVRLVSNNNSHLDTDASTRENNTYSSNPVEQPLMGQPLIQAVFTECFNYIIQRMSNLISLSLAMANMYAKFVAVTGGGHVDLDDGVGICSSNLDLRSFDYEGYVSDSMEHNQFVLSVPSGQSCGLYLDYLVFLNDSSLFLHLSQEYEVREGCLYEIDS